MPHLTKQQLNELCSTRARGAIEVVRKYHKKALALWVELADAILTSTPAGRPDSESLLRKRLADLKGWISEGIADGI